MMSPKTPEDRAEMCRKLAIAAGLPVSEIGEFIVRKASVERPTRPHVTLGSNDNEDRAEIGRKLEIAAGII